MWPTDKDIYKEFSSVFINVLGCLKSKAFKLYLKPDTKPVFFKPRILTVCAKSKSE